MNIDFDELPSITPWAVLAGGALFVLFSVRLIGLVIGCAAVALGAWLLARR